MSEREVGDGISRTGAFRAPGLWLLYAFTLVSLAGFATFGQHPEMLANQSAETLRFYAMSFRLFAVGQVALAGIVIAFFLTRHVKWKWLPAFAALYAISLMSELMGTGYGIPFGAYAYSEVLAPMWLGRVPVGIPLSWFYMAVPAYALSLEALPGPGKVGHRIGLASFVLLAWDLALDPAMSSATKYWEWGETGPYYGMPMLNLVGWYVTGIVLMGALVALRSDSWIRLLPTSWLRAFYGANLLLAVGMCAAAGLWGAVVVTLVVLAAAATLTRLATTVSLPSSVDTALRSQ